MPATALTLAVVAGFLTVFGFMTPEASAGDKKPTQIKEDAYNFSFITIDGSPLQLPDYRNKVLLIVNTASRCGFTPQYEGLQKLYDTYKDRGLVIIGVPSNDFGGQEPGSNQEIKKFCEMKFATTFPMTEKTTVTGDNAHPFYKWAAEQGKGGPLASKPRWNFHKYLISADGYLAGSFTSLTKPESSTMTKAIEVELAKIKP